MIDKPPAPDGAEEAHSPHRALLPASPLTKGGPRGVLLRVRAAKPHEPQAPARGLLTPEGSRTVATGEAKSAARRTKRNPWSRMIDKPPAPDGAEEAHSPHRALLLASPLTKGGLRGVLPAVRANDSPRPRLPSARPPKHRAKPYRSHFVSRCSMTPGELHYSQSVDGVVPCFNVRGRDGPRGITVPNVRG